MVPVLARQFDPTFGFIGYCRKEYLTFSSPCDIFELLGMAPTYAVLGLLKLERGADLGRSRFVFTCAAVKLFSALIT